MYYKSPRVNNAKMMPKWYACVELLSTSASGCGLGVSSEFRLFVSKLTVTNVFRIIHGIYIYGGKATSLAMDLRECVCNLICVCLLITVKADGESTSTDWVYLHVYNVSIYITKSISLSCLIVALIAANGLYYYSSLHGSYGLPIASWLMLRHLVV